ncbi:unnamed protein product [Polarella glacialis]|uniref:Uncharacterized protein n=1 Tax=Polarella glacialis TaxID=89957 RepID=A0A813JVG7_POLGL|nr:unnamed protein product [Polarella glacialis]
MPYSRSGDATGDAGTSVASRACPALDLSLSLGGNSVARSFAEEFQFQVAKSAVGAGAGSLPDGDDGGDGSNSESEGSELPQASAFVARSGKAPFDEATPASSEDSGDDSECAIVAMHSPAASSSGASSGQTYTPRLSLRPATE